MTKQLSMFQQGEDLPLFQQVQDEQAERRPARIFWLPWCTGRYRQEFIDRKVPELRASGKYWGVRVVNHQIQVKIGTDADGRTIDRNEVTE